MRRSVLVAIGAALALVFAGGWTAYRAAVARREVRLTVVNDRATAIGALDVGGTPIGSLAPGERVVVPFQPTSALWARYRDDRGEAHFDRRFDLCEECLYWPPCGRPTLHVLETGTTFDDGPRPSAIVATLLDCD